MLIQMRNTVTKIIMFMLFGLLIASFAVWGIGDIFRTDSHYPTVAKVGDIDITQVEFSQELAQEMNLLRQRYGPDLDAAQAQSLGAVAQVLQRLVNQALVNQQATDLRLAVPESELQRSILNEPAFKDSLGNFAPERFSFVLRNAGLTEERYLETLRNQYRRNQISSALTGAVAVPDTVVELLYRYDGEKRTAETLTIELAPLPDDLTPSDLELQNVIQGNLSRFQTPELRALSLIQLRVDDISDPSIITEEILTAAFEERREQLGRPERRAVQQLVFAEEADAQAAVGKMQDGLTFEATSQETLGRGPVDLGNVTKAELGLQFTELADAAFVLETETASDPVQTPFGWHILYVTEIEPAFNPTLEDVRESLTQDLAREAAGDTVISLANAIDDELALEASLEEISQRLALPLVKVEALDGQGQDANQQAVADLPALEEFLPVLGRTKMGETSLLTETPQGDFFVLRVDGITPPGTKPLSEVREDAVALWEAEKRLEITKAEAELLADTLRAGTTMADLAEAESLNLETTADLARQDNQATTGFSRELIEALFRATDGEIVAAPGQGGYVIAKLMTVEVPDPAADQELITQIKDSMGRNLQEDFLTGYFTELHKEIGVTVNQRLIDETLALQ